MSNILCGSDNEQVTGRGHQELTTFGLLQDMPVAEVRGYIEQLIAHGFLRQTDDQFPVVTLTAPGVELLKDASGAPDLVLARQRRPVAERRRAAPGARRRREEGGDAGRAVRRRDLPQLAWRAVARKREGGWLVARTSQLDKAGNWKLETGSWKLEADL